MKTFKLFFLPFLVMSCFSNDDEISSKGLAFPCFFSISPALIASGESFLISSTLEQPWESLKSIHVLGNVLTEKNPTLEVTLGATTSIRATAMSKDGSQQYCEQTIIVTGKQSGVACSLSVNPPVIDDNIKNVTALLTVSGENLSQIQATFIGEKNLESTVGGSLDLTLDSAQLIVGRAQLKEEAVYCDFQVRNQSQLCQSEANESQTKELAAMNESFDQEFEDQIKIDVTAQLGSSFEQAHVIAISSHTRVQGDVCEFFKEECAISENIDFENHTSLKRFGIVKVGGKFYEYIHTYSDISFRVYQSQDSYFPLIYKNHADPKFLDIDLCSCERVENPSDHIADGAIPPEPVEYLYYFEVPTATHVLDKNLLEPKEKQWASFRKNIISPEEGQHRPICPRDWDWQS